MKEVKAYIRRAKRDAVIDALEQLDRPPTFAVVPVQEFGHEVETGRLERVEMIKFEVDIPDERVDEIVACIVENGRTGEGHAGDGRVVVLGVEDATRVGDGTRGDPALQ